VGYRVERARVEVLSEDQLVPQRRRTPPLSEPSAEAVRRIGAFVRLTDSPVPGPRYADAIDLSRPRPIAGPPAWERRIPPEQLDERGRPYRWAVFAYRVRAVNALGVEGGPSPYALTLPAGPPHLFARERSGACDLRGGRPEVRPSGTGGRPCRRPAGLPGHARAGRRRGLHRRAGGGGQAALPRRRGGCAGQGGPALSPGLVCPRVGTILRALRGGVA